MSTARKVTSQPRLIWITDVTNRGATATLAAAEQLCSLAAPGALCIQLRDKTEPVRERRALGAALRTLTAQHGQLFTVNERLDLALVLGADGVHLGETSVRASEARRLIAGRGRSWWITQAAHAVRSELDHEVDALLLAPIFFSNKGLASLGLPALAAQCSASEIPVYALGGLSIEVCDSVSRVGAQGVAAISAGYDEPLALIRALNVLR